ncbi:MAG: DUF354 domain-containing protein [Asgard group archaeon]|nr:DUF354 domain-containing protein [Asgard group archaeon]
MVNNKLIWFDVLTPKQAMLFIAIGKKLTQLGFESIYTTRNHDYILDIFKHYNIKPLSYGSYGGKDLDEKLIASAKRVLDISKHFIKKNIRPSIAISFSSPDATRIAFGLAIPIILMNDTAHSIPVAKLTFSLARYLITPSCINKNDFTKLGAQPEIIHQYQGVDENEYITHESLKQLKEYRECYKQEKYVIFRPEESFASYMKDKDAKPYLEILRELKNNYSNKILVLPRYEKQRQVILTEFDGEIEIPPKGYFYLKMFCNAEVVITGGGTMGREAALLGIPSITYFWRHLEPQKFIEEKGFPSFSAQTMEETKKLIKKICSQPKDYHKNTTQLLTKLEKPSNLLISLIKNDPELKELLK